MLHSESQTCVSLVARIFQVDFVCVCVTTSCKFAVCAASAIRTKPGQDEVPSERTGGAVQVGSWNKDKKTTLVFRKFIFLQMNFFDPSCIRWAQFRITLVVEIKMQRIMWLQFNSKYVQNSAQQRECQPNSDIIITVTVIIITLLLWVKLPVMVWMGMLSSKKSCSRQASSLLGAGLPILISTTLSVLCQRWTQWKVARWQLCTDCTVNLETWQHDRMRRYQDQVTWVNEAVDKRRTHV